jgi:hypothetical protein
VTINYYIGARTFTVFPVSGNLARKSTESSKPVDQQFLEVGPLEQELSLVMRLGAAATAEVRAKRQPVKRPCEYIMNDNRKCDTNDSTQNKHKRKWEGVKTKEDDW